MSELEVLQEVAHHLSWISGILTFVTSFTVGWIIGGLLWK